MGSEKPNRSSSSLPDDLVQRARATSVAEEALRRSPDGLLKRHSHYLIGPCPGRGGTDRFNVSIPKNSWYCRGIHAGGDAIALVQHVEGLDFREAVLKLTGERAPELPRIRSAPAPKVAPADAVADDERRRQQAVRWWGEAVPIEGTVAETYLTVTRGLRLPADISRHVLRFHPDLPFGEARHPCLIGLYVDIAGVSPRALMRIALTPNGRKIGKLSYAPTAGAVIKLTDDADVAMSLTIGEGLETTLAGTMAGLSPAWCLGNAGAVASFPVLSGIETLRILVDRDEAGQKAAQACADRWAAAGREVIGIRSEVEGEDFADIVTGAAA